MLDQKTQKKLIILSKRKGTKMLNNDKYLTQLKYTDAQLKRYLIYNKYKILVKYMKHVKYSLRSGGVFYGF
jgi:hypothetical protein